MRARAALFPLVLAALLPWALLACGGGGKGAIPTPSLEAGQPLPPALQRMLEDVATVRELSPPGNLEVAFVSRSEVPALLDHLTTGSDRQSFAQLTTLYRLLGHLSKNQTYEGAYRELTNQAVVGLYSPKDKQLWVVHPDGQAAELSQLTKDQQSTLAHELVHAVQDYHYDLAKLTERTGSDLDWSLATTAVIEGDAVVNEKLYAARYLAVPRGSAVLLVSQSVNAAVPPSISRELFFPYTTGADFVGAIRQAKGVSRVNGMFVDPPRGTAFVMHPELLDSGFAPRQVQLPDVAKALGNGWKHESGGTWGEFQVQNYLLLRVRALDAAAAAKGWAGDHYNVYVNGGESVAVFRLAFADASEAQQFRDAQAQLLKAAGGKGSQAGDITLDETGDGNTTARLQGSGNEVLFAIGTSKEVADRALRALAGG